MKIDIFGTMFSLYYSPPLRLFPPISQERIAKKFAQKAEANSNLVSKMSVAICLA